MCSDSETEYSDSDKEEVKHEEPPAGVTGLALAEHYFGPLLSPDAATPARWTTYTEHRRGVNAKYRNVFDRRKRCVSDSVAKIEKELGLENGMLQKCISILWRIVERDDVDVNGVRSIPLASLWTPCFQPCNADILVRIYSLAAPKYVDVHIKYHCRSRSSSVEWSWFYSIGYNIYNRICGSPTDYSVPSMDCDDPAMWHSSEGWRSICWGLYDDNGDCSHRWHRVEGADMGLHEHGVLDVHEALFGFIDMPTSDDANAVLAYRRKLVATVRLLLAALGIDYEVACTDEETDRGPYDYMLEGWGDEWVARGIRKACGFQLSGDTEAARCGEEERREEEASNEDEDDSNEEWRRARLRPFQPGPLYRHYLPNIPSHRSTPQRLGVHNPPVP